MPCLTCRRLWRPRSIPRHSSRCHRNNSKSSSQGGHRTGTLTQAVGSTSRSRCSISIGFSPHAPCAARHLKRPWASNARFITKMNRFLRPAPTSPYGRGPGLLQQAGRRCAAIATETGAGQWGTALAFSCAMLGMECTVYMVRVSYDQKPYRRILINAYAGEIFASPRPTPAPARPSGRGPELRRLPRTGHLRGRGGRGHPRRYQIRLGQRAQPCVCTIRP